MRSKPSTLIKISVRLNVYVVAYLLGVVSSDFQTSIHMIFCWLDQLRADSALAYLQFDRLKSERICLVNLFIRLFLPAHPLTIISSCLGTIYLTFISLHLTVSQHLQCIIKIPIRKQTDNPYLSLNRAVIYYWVPNKRPFRINDHIDKYWKFNKRPVPN